MIKATISRKIKLHREGGLVRYMNCYWRVCKITPYEVELVRVNDED